MLSSSKERFRFSARTLSVDFSANEKELLFYRSDFLDLKHIITIKAHNIKVGSSQQRLTKSILTVGEILRKF